MTARIHGGSPQWGNLCRPCDPGNGGCGGDGVSQRAFCPAQAISLGRTDERAWTPLATATGTTATTHATTTTGVAATCTVTAARATATTRVIPSRGTSYCGLITES
jgi:hypothetical protein